MLKAGITGGIGSGKSTAAKVFEWLGVPVYYADNRGKFLLNNNEEVIQKVKDVFGEKFYNNDGQLKRQELAKVVFADKNKLKQLEEIVHPAVKKDYEIWASKLQHVPYTIKEAALLFESGSYRELDLVIFVSAPLEAQIQRVMLRDNVSRNAVEQRMNKQLPDAEKQALSEYILLNDGQHLLVPQVFKLHKTLLELNK